MNCLRLLQFMKGRFVRFENILRGFIVNYFERSCYEMGRSQGRGLGHHVRLRWSIELR